MKMPEEQQIGPKNEPVPADRIAALSRRGFTRGAIAAAMGVAGFSWVNWFAERNAGASWPLRRILEFNQTIAQALYSPKRLSPEFAPAYAAEPRPNGRVGLSKQFDVAAWKLTFECPGLMARSIALSEIQALPRVEMVTELKCVEGWSQVVQWTGARMFDFLAAFTTPKDANEEDGVSAEQFRYVSLTTPDEAYFVGIDMPSALHPQTLLCYEMNGEPLTLSHGAPLRLVIPHKYGIKNIKRIGNISLTNDRPVDYWAQRGYDWYAGL